MTKKFAYHAGDFKYKYGTLRQGLSGTSFVSGYFYTTTKEACEYQGAGFNLDHKRPVYQFSLEGLNLLSLTAEGCRTLNLYNKVCYNYPIYVKYCKGECSNIRQILDMCFEDFYCDSVADDKKPVKFFRELSDFYNSEKEYQDKDFDFQTFIDNYFSLQRLKESLKNSDQLPYLKQILELNEFVFTDNQELVDELDDFLYNVDLACRLNEMIEKVAKLLHKSSEFISDEALEMYKKYEAYYRNDRFDNFSAPEDDLFATQLLKKLNYVGTYPIDEIADSTEFGGCIFDIENIKNTRLVENMNKTLKENRLAERYELQEDFEFYTKPNGKISIDKVIKGSSKSGKYFNDGTGFIGDTSQAIKRIPLSQMSDDDKELAQAAYKTLRKNGSIDSVDQQFKTSPKADVVMKADGAHADIYYDDNVTGVPDEKNVRLVNEAKMKSFFENLLEF